MSKFMKNCFIALLAGTALCVTMGVQGAKADLIDSDLRECDKAQAFGILTPQGVEYCKEVLRLKQERDLRDYQLNIFPETINNPNNTQRQLRDNPKIQPLEPGIGNNRNWQNP
ncbi:hypothetical protein F7734_00990 [Scytonema sp. UIC 10036]|uniref:hypothetical protein n=1 Tax=Scytonema sp. UIC 10036 TaxID=2304196 RepID=UPI0012DA594A|nr:hypothetical protein [Scytonema sp. UIC 10036]MUG91150.1 hypothetical protein [Scytonema sp. UIC 10036]